MNQDERFLLMATEEQRWQLLLVDLFLESLEAAALMAGLGNFRLSMQQVHEHFPAFAAATRAAGVRDRSPEAYCPDANGACPAVLLYTHRGNTPRHDDKNTVHIPGLHLASEAERRATIEGLIRGIPTLKLDVEYEIVVALGNEVLKKLGELDDEAA